MGNQIISKRQPTSRNGKVILSDGSIHKYDHPLTVAELMLEYPQQFVIEFQSVAASKRPCPLPADKKLEMDKLYVMLPIKGGKPASLSSEQSRHLLFRANTILKSSSTTATFSLPFFAKICPAENWEENECVTKKRETIMDEKILNEEKDDLFGDILEERPDYLHRTVSGKGWKPSLDTIKEKSIKPKVRHWLY